VPCAAAEGRSPALSVGGRGRSGATDPGTVLSVGDWVLRERLPPTAATAPGADSVGGRRWCWCTARRGRRGRGDASLRVWPSASACMCSTCLASASSTNAADRTSRSPGTGLAWPPCSSTGGATARRSSRTTWAARPACARTASSPQRRGPRSQEVFEQLPAAIHEGVLRAYVGTARPRPLDSEVEDRLIAPWLGATGQSAFYRQIAAGTQRHTDAIEPLLDKISAPTLVVWGEAILGCPPRLASSSPSGSLGPVSRCCPQPVTWCRRTSQTSSRACSAYTSNLCSPNTVTLQEGAAPA
jgi:hypothetical protein